MSFGAFCVLGLVLVIIGSVVGPSTSKPKPKNPPARAKNEGETQEKYANAILKGRDIREFPASELPIPDRNKPKYIFTDDSATVEGFLKNGGFVAKFVETTVTKIEDETAFKLTVQNYWSNLLLCVQRIKIYEELETPEELKARLAAEENRKVAPGNSITSSSNAPQGGGENSENSGDKNKTPRRKFKDSPREDILAKCEGGYDLKPHTRYRFGFANAIYFYGANRILFKIFDPNLGAICHERSYTVSGKRDKPINERQCNTRIERIFTWQGAIRNFFWNLIHNPMSLITRRALKEK